MAMPDGCSHWRLLASCELDGELSDLDAVRLEHHLTGCGACAAWLSEAHAAATSLRSAELDVPARLDLSARSRRIARVSSIAAAAAAASVAAAALAILPIALPTTGGRTTTRPAQRAEIVKRGSCSVCLPRKFVLLSLNGELYPQQTPGHGAVLS
jgi:predicted anti-sigma-YlaC factor YlaD